MPLADVELSKEENEILDFELRNLRGSICGFTIDKLQKMGMKTLRDLLHFDFKSYFKTQLSTHSPAKHTYSHVYDKDLIPHYKSKYVNNLQRKTSVNLLNKISNTANTLKDYTSFKSEDIADEKILLTPIKKTPAIISSSVVFNFDNIKLITIKDLLNYDLRKLFILDGFGINSMKKIVRIMTNLKARPDSIYENTRLSELTEEIRISNELSLSDQIPETFQDHDGKLRTRQEFLSINLSNFSDIMSYDTHMKFSSSKIKSFKDLLDKKASELTGYLRINTGFFNDYFAIRNDIVKNYAFYCNPYVKLPRNIYQIWGCPYGYEIYSERKEYREWEKINNQIPFDADITESDNLTEIFKTVIIDYQAAAEKIKGEGSILPLYYGINTSKKSTKEIASIINRSLVYCQKLLHTELENIETLLKGKYLKDLKLWLRRSVQNLFLEIIRQLTSEPVHLYSDLKKLFTSENSEISEEEKENLFELFLNGIDYYVFKPSTYSILEERMVVEKTYNTRLINELSKEINFFLKNRKEPVSENEIIKHLWNTEQKTAYNFITGILTFLPDIEIATFEDSNHYYHKNIKTRQNSDIIYDLLLKRGKKTLKTDLFNEFKLQKHVERQLNYIQFGVLIKNDKRFINIGKTGYWALAEWNPNTDSQRELVRKILLKLKRAATIAEIFEKVNKSRPDMSKRSIWTILARYFLTISPGIYILPEWKNQYPDVIIKPEIEKTDPGDWPSNIELRKRLIEILCNQVDNKLKLNEIYKIIKTENPSITAQKLSKLCGSEKYFKKTHDKNNKPIIGVI
jgi:hypothetical protein